MDVRAGVDTFARGAIEFHRDEAGGETVEWPLLVALIATIAAGLAWPVLGEGIRSAVAAVAAAFG